MAGDGRPRVVFACTQNAGRSQIAAALFNLHAKGRATADSAGTRPARHVHPEVVEVMREVGVDLRSAVPKLLTPGFANGVARVITMGCGDECPVLNAPIEDWALPDPAGQPLPAVRALRDEIELRVLDLLATLDKRSLKSS